MKEVKENGFFELDDKDLEQVSGGCDGCVAECPVDAIG